MDTRRQFLVRSGAVAAATVLAPQDALAAKRKQRRPKDMLRGGRFAQGVMSGDPAPDAITLLTLVDDVGGAGRVRLEVARDPDFRRVIARRDILTTRRREPLREGARHGPQAAQALLLPLRDARPAQPGRAVPDGAPAGLARDRPVRLLLLRQLHRRLLQRVCRAGARGPRLRRLAGRLHLRRGDRRGRRRPRGARRPHRQAEPVLPDDAARGGDAARVPGQVRALPHRRVAAPHAPAAARSSPPGTTTRSRTTTPTMPTTAGCRCAGGSRAPAATPRIRRSSSRCRCSRAGGRGSTGPSGTAGPWS